MSVYSKILDCIPEQVTIQDRNHRIIEANRATSVSVGMTPEEVLGKICYKARFKTSGPCEGCPVEKVFDTGKEQQAEITTPDGECLLTRAYPFKSENGDVSQVLEIIDEITERSLLKLDESIVSEETKGIGVDYSGEQARLVIASDVTEQKRDKEELQASLNLLQIANNTETLKDLIREVVTYFKDLYMCDAVGIRLHNADDFPYFETRGFSSEFVLAENNLCAIDQKGEVIRDNDGNPVIECMCGNVICGRFNPDLPFFTKNGSFWSNCTTDLLASTNEEDRQVRTRNRCNGEGYESVGLIPLRFKSETYGLLQINAKRKNLFTAESIALAERLADYLGIALSQHFAKEALTESEIKYRQLVEALQEGIWVLDEAGNTTYVNENMAKLLEYRVDEMVGRHLFSFMDENWVEIAKKNLERGLDVGKQTIEFEFLKKNGTGIYLMMETAPIFDDDGTVKGAIAGVIDITDRKFSEILIAKQNKDLEAALNYNTELTSRVAHDIRSPLVPIFSYAELLLDGSLCDMPVEATEPLKAIQSSANELSKLAEDFLTLSMIEMGSLDNKPEPVQVADRIQTIVADYQLGKFDKSVSISWSGDKFELYLDPARFNQVLRNLIDNAIKYSGNKVDIEIHTSIKENTALISVKDNGLGIPADKLTLIFKPFYRVVQDETRRIKGTGLGLSISRDFVRLMGGTLTAESKVGIGSTFTIEFPIGTG